MTKAEFSLALATRGLLVPPFAMPALLDDAAMRSPGRAWVLGPEGEWTYGEARVAAAAFARRLRDGGVAAGDRVAICLPNGPGAALALHACWFAGAIPALLHPAYAPDLQARQLALCGARHLIGSGTRAEALATRAGVTLIEIRPQTLPRAGDVPALEAPGDLDAVALLQFTGGTTGEPKAAMLSHRNLSMGLGQIATALSGLEAEREISLAVAPYSHITGLNGVLGLMTYIRGCVVAPAPVPAQLAAACIDYRVTYLAGPPTMLSALAEAAASCPGRKLQVRYVIAGGAPLPDEVATRFEAVTGAKVLDGYGLSETAPAVLLGGRAVAGTHVELRNVQDGTPVNAGTVGEVCVRGPQIMLGYWSNPAATAAVLNGGWLRTGDLGVALEDGRVAIVDRLKDIIIASGYNVYPARVEDAVYRHPAVAEVAVVGIPDAYRGETVAAVVALRPGARLTLAELTSFLEAQLSPMEMPRLLHIMDELPKSPAGKILRRNVREGMEAANREM